MLIYLFPVTKKTPATLSLPLRKVLLDVEFRVGRDIEYISRWSLSIWPMRKQRVNVEPHAINGGVSDFQSVQFQQLSMLSMTLHTIKAICGWIKISSTYHIAF